IPLLQQSVKDTRIAGPVLVALGECFLADKKPQLARRQFEKALQHLDPQDDADLFKKTHYYLGRICEDAGEKSKAEEHYSEVLAIDYEYKDTLKRLESLQAEESS
ncbi:MAG: tetratricopeptide repeat protein, partial [Planctomycetes bacterium]|nr:tetratricopeptide repeat protein [Planctomycetota bacterium]